MAENYVVNYDINVKAQTALQTLQTFQTATEKLSTAGRRLTEFQKKIETVTGKLAAMSRKAPVLDISTAKVNKKLDTVISKMERIHRLAKQSVTMGATTTGGTSGTKGSKTAPAPTPTPSSPKPSKPTPARPVPARKSSVIPRNIAYRTLGPTMIDSGGVGALDLLKGMGIAYGISGLGSMFSNVLTSATDYDNIMQTAKNILGTHDKEKGFTGRFKNMAQTVRNVGVETKFTAPQVAEASKFLAMAGFDINAINNSIRPISDIALVGDTDLGATADVVTNIMTGYKISPDKVRHAADVMTMTFTKSNTTLMEMAEAYKYSASLLSAGGVSFEEASGGLGILGDAGIKGSQAGTTMRTIMSNIVNPTKKQLEQWDKLGIARTNADGTMRPLTDIFGDLNDAELYVSDFYKLFHKTAAQGAVALTTGVDKWNEIVELNFLSDGIVSKLADAKKNTIQGLWAQLTSMFTEDGMQAFEELQAPIVKLLNDVIKWLKTPEAVTAIKDMAHAIFDLIKFFVKFTGTLLQVYQHFKGLIKLWLTTQVALTAIIAPLRVVQSLLNFGGFVVKSVQSIALLTSSFGRLFTSLRSGKTLLATMPALLGGVAGSATGGGYSIGELRQMVLARQQGKHPAMGILGPMAQGVGGMVGAGAGAYLGSMIGDPGSWQSTVGGLGGAVLGGGLGAWGASALPALLSNPVGWAVMAAAAIGGAAYYFKQYHDAVDRCTAANNDFLESTQSINGINYSEHASMADKYLSIVYDKQLDANRAIGEHINLIREQLGLMKSADELMKDSKPFKDSHKGMFDNANKAYGIWSTLDEAKAAATGNILNPDGTVDQSMHVFRQANLNGAGRTFYTNRFNGIDYGVGTPATYSALSASRLLYGLGRDTGEGSQARKMIDNYLQRILLSQSPDDFFSIIKTLNSDAQGLPITPGSEGWTMSQIGDNSLATNQTGYHYVTALRQTLFDQFRWNRPTTANANLLATWKDILGNHTQNQSVPQDLLKKFLLQSGVDIFNTSRYQSFGSTEFMKQFGWDNGQWNTKDFTFFNQKTGKEETIILTAAEAQKNFVSFHQQITDVVHKLSPKIQPYFASLVNSPIWGLGTQTAGQAPQNKIGSKRTINGKTYEWHIQPPYTTPMWWPIDGGEPLEDTVTDESNKPALGANGGANASDYKSRYNSNAAAPKQVIVKIENLMNVENVDLANPDNAAAIADIKTQLTQALVDVVHDFDETYHG